MRDNCYYFDDTTTLNDRNYYIFCQGYVLAGFMAWSGLEGKINYDSCRDSRWF